MSTTPSPSPDSDDRRLTLPQLGRAMRRNLRLVLGFTLGAMAVAGVVSLLLPSKYESTASVRVVGSMDQSGMLEDVSSFAGGALSMLGMDDVDTEMAVLRSRRIVGEVADSLGLHVEVEAPEDLRRSEVFRSLDAPRDAVAGEYVLRRVGAGVYELAAERVRVGPDEYSGAPDAIRARVGPPQRVAIGEEFQIGGMTIALAPGLADEAPDEIAFEVHPFLETVEELREDLRIRRTDGSKLISVGYRSRDPELSAAVVNGITGTFLEYKRTTSHSDARKAIEVLSDQVRLFEEQLLDAEERLRVFQETQNAVAPEVQAEAEVERIAQIQVARDANAIQRNALAELLEEMRRESASVGGTSVYRQLLALPSLIDNEAIQNVLVSLIALEDTLATELVMKTPEHRDVQALTTRIEDLENQLHRLGTDYLENLDTNIAAADAALAGFREELRELPAQAIRVAHLTREIETLGEVYLLLQKRLKEAEVADLIETGDVRLVDTGPVPEEPEFPKPLFNVVLGGLLGLLVGFVAVIGRESADTTVRSRADAETVSSGLPVLGNIPHIAAPAVNGNGQGAARDPRWRRFVALPGRIVGAPEPVPSPARLVTRWAPHDYAAEAFRALRTNITFAFEGETPQVLVLTSTLPGEGKSTTAANLAVALAQQGTRTVLVDADLRRGVLDRLLGTERTPGLADVLQGRQPLESAVHEVVAGAGGEPLHFVPHGSFAPNPADLLGSDAMTRVLEKLRAGYDAVVIDTPALQLVTDAALLGRLADASLIVVRSGVTEQDALREAVERLQRLRAPIGGIVLNDARTLRGQRDAYAKYRRQAEIEEAPAN